jgi:hypothetical protein
MAHFVLHITGGFHSKERERESPRRKGEVDMCGETPDEATGEDAGGMTEQTEVHLYATGARTC